MISISEEDFHRHYWPKLESAINLILQQNPGEFIPISYEETYSAVYKCVCQQHSEKLYENLMLLISNILARIKEELESQPVDMYLNRFAHIMSQYLQSVEGIAAIFNYMNRFYVKPKKNSELKSELLMLFTASIADSERLFEILNHCAAQPFSSDPKILMSIVQGLYMLRPEFAEKNVDLFSRFIPNLVGHACSLDEEINETKALQENLRNQEEFLRGENVLKRDVDAAEMPTGGPVKKCEPMT